MYLTIRVVFLLYRKHYRPLHTLLPTQSSPIPDGLWSFLACFLFPLYLNPLQPRASPSFTQSLFFLSRSIVAVAIWFDALWPCIYSTWPYHLSRRDIINLTVSAPCNMSFIARIIFGEYKPWCFSLSTFPQAPKLYKSQSMLHYETKIFFQIFYKRKID
jgi:hypothetical protein